MIGTYLLLDGHNLELDQATRVIGSPVRPRPTPVISSDLAQHGCANFSNTIFKGVGYRGIYVAALDKETTQRYTAYSASANGLDWSYPVQVAPTGAEFSDVLDEGVAGPERYKAYRKSSDLSDLPPRWKGELWVSPDMIHWQRYGNVTSLEYGENWQPVKVGSTYILLHRWNIKDFWWIDKEGQFRQNTTHDPTFVRCVGVTSSFNPHSFPPSTLLFAPDGLDSGETQFYSVSSIIQRGQYLIGCLHVLRDDLKAAGGPAGAYGTGYSVLIWSVDGLTWTRSRQPFLSPQAGKWDGAITWIDSIVPTDNQVRLYYGGYRYGHKVYSDRQIGVAEIKKDRYVAAVGKVRTKPFSNSARLLYLNLDGVVKVRVLDAGNAVLKAVTVTGNAVNKLVDLDLKPYQEQVIKLEFEGGKLYSFRLAA